MEVDALLDAIAYKSMDARENISSREECRAGRRESTIVTYVTRVHFKLCLLNSSTPPDVDSAPHEGRPGIQATMYLLMESHPWYCYLYVIGGFSNTLSCW